VFFFLWFFLFVVFFVFCLGLFFFFCDLSSKIVSLIRLFIIQ